MDKSKFYDKEMIELWKIVKEGKELSLDQVKTLVLLDIAKMMKKGNPEMYDNPEHDNPSYDNPGHSEYEETPKTDLEKAVEELAEYAHDHAKQKKKLEETGNLDYRNHALLEFQRLVECYEVIGKLISEAATLPEEKALL